MALRTPLYDRHEAAGARFVDFAGFEMPVRYSTLREEHLRVRATVGLFDVSHMGEVRVTGPGAGEALDWLCSNSIRDLDVGGARYTLMCNRSGGVVDDLIVYRLGQEDFLVVVNAANREKDFEWMRANNPRPDDASFVDEGDAWAQIAVQGPKGPELTAALTELPVLELSGFQHLTGRFAGVDGCLVARTGYTGEDGFEIYCPAQHAGAVWDALMEAGAPYEVAPIGLGARDTLRLEVRFPLYGHELSDDLAPHQARLMWVTKLDKPGGFLGADAIRKRRDEGLDTHFLCGAVLEGKRIAREGNLVLDDDGNEIGWVTSGTRAPSLDRSVALAYVKRGHGRPGSQLTFDIRGRTATGTVVKGPFYTRDA